MGWLTFRRGTWIWGVCLFLWLTFVVGTLLLTGLGVHCWPIAGFDEVLKENNTLAASITAVLGVVWSWFVQMGHKKPTGPRRRTKSA